MIIREAGEIDREGYAEVGRLATEILRKVYHPREGGALPKIEKETVRLVAVEGAKVIGTVRYYIDGEGIHLIGLMVHPDFHRCGIGRSLVEYLVLLAKERNLKVLSLYTIKETGNVPVFEKMGFKVEREEADVSWAQSDIFEQLTDVFMEMCCNL